MSEPKRDTRFQPGNSGRPRGARNKTSLAVAALLEGEAEKVGRMAVQKALEGDMAAIRLVIERICPPKKDRPVEFELPPIDTLADAKTASSAVLAAVAAGDITPMEGAAVMGLLVSHKTIVETTDFEARLAALETKGS